MLMRKVVLVQESAFGSFGSFGRSWTSGGTATRWDQFFGGNHPTEIWGVGGHLLRDDWTWLSLSDFRRSWRLEAGKSYLDSYTHGYNIYIFMYDLYISLYIAITQSASWLFRRIHMIPSFSRTPDSLVKIQLVCCCTLALQIPSSQGHDTKWTSENYRIEENTRIWG